MTAKAHGATAFDQGQTAGKNSAGPPAENPFAEGTPEHNNFEVGRRFGAANTVDRHRPSSAAMKPDADEGSD